MKKIVVIELDSKLGEFNPDVIKSDFSDAWSKLITHPNEIINVYQFEKKKYQSLIKQIFKKKEIAQLPQIKNIGRLEEKTEKELKIIKYGSFIGFCDYFYEVENNSLLYNLFELYSNKYEIHKGFIEHFREDEKNILLKYLDQFEDKSKLITISHDGNPIFIIFFSEESFNFFSKGLNNLNA